MASLLSPQLSRFFYSNSLGSENRTKITVNVPHSPKFNANNGLLKNYLSNGFLSARYTSLRGFSLRALSSMAASYSDQPNGENRLPVATARGREMEFNRVNCLVWMLHESARSFSVAIQSLELAKSGPELAMAWVGVDLHAWHKDIAHQVAVYALLKSAVEVELLSREHCNDPSPVLEILSPKINLAEGYIENQLKMRHPNLVGWFRMVEIRRIAGCFIPLLKKWFLEYAGRDHSGYKLLCCSRKIGL